MYRTSDQIASEFIAEGVRRSISPRGQVIAIATGLVESNLKVYANPAVPESLSLPHDDVASDGRSVGPLQQQVVWGNGGWWWGDARKCMDPTLSVGLFYDRLVKTGYLSANTDVAAGAIAQSIQGSAYPDRYAKRMGEAQSIYDRLKGRNGGVAVVRPAFNEIERMGNSCQGRGGQKPRYFFLHTQDGGGNAQSLASYLNNPSNESSYHYTIDNGVTVVDVVDTDYASWSVGDANNYSINLCFAGSRASWSRSEWLNNMGNAIDVAAYLAVQDCRKYGMSMSWLGSGGRYKAANSGISDHEYVTRVIGWGSHTDCGPGFPGDVFAAAVAKYSGAAPVVNEINAAAARAAAWIGERIDVNERVCPDGVGRFVAYTNAHIYWHPKFGAHPIPHGGDHGGLFAAFAEYGFEVGSLGYPVLDHAVIPGGGVQAFSGGVLYKQDGAEHGYFVGGDILARYAKDGYEKSPHGWPVSNEFDRDGGRAQKFENATLAWRPDKVVKL